MQLYREGPNDKIITFLEVERFGQKMAIPQAFKDVKTLEYLPGSTFQALINAEKLGTEYALLESQRPDHDGCISPDFRADGWAVSLHV